MNDVATNWRRVRERAASAAARVGRDATSVRIVAVSKAKPVEMIEAVIAAGATEIGENYVQEAEPKIGAIGRRVVWHMIGHLQRNKAVRAVELFDVIQAVDSLPLARALDRCGERRGAPVRVLVEVNVGAEVTKHGLGSDQVEAFLAALGELRGLQVDGLMAIPPPAASADAARADFRALRVLRDRLQARTPPNAPLRELSMGMTDDFEVAIEEGATIVRVGRAIFGARVPR